MGWLKNLHKQANAQINSSIIARSPKYQNNLFHQTVVNLNLRTLIATCVFRWPKEYESPIIVVPVILKSVEFQVGGE